MPEYLNIPFVGRRIRETAYVGRANLAKLEVCGTRKAKGNDEEEGKS